MVASTQLARSDATNTAPAAVRRRLSHAQMYARLLASDASYNGHFFTGVLTTGIYCLPSCKARKPRSENVRFFPTCEAARAAGLRACRKCHPDDFARGADPVLTDIETLVAEIRADPATFADVRAVVRRSGFGATRLIELFRLHFHSTPHEILLRARLVAAQRALTGRASGLLEVAQAVGFESLSVFHDQFRRFTGLTPTAYRELGQSASFAVQLPVGFPLGYLRRALSRDPHSVTERLEGQTYTTVFDDSAGPQLLRLQLSDDAVTVRCERPESALAAHAFTVGLLGLDQSAASFARLAKKLGLGRLVAGREELRISQTPSVFDGLLWSIIGQQITFGFACQLRRRLIEHVSRPFADGLYPPLKPAAVARLEPADLLPLQFSRQKAGYLVEVARMVDSGQLELDELRSQSATRVERRLLAIRGLGPWSVNYVMMRALGFADCIPIGDTGVTSGLQSLFGLETRPDAEATRRLMMPFAPFRSYATAHLWQYNQPQPDLA